MNNGNYHSRKTFHVMYEDGLRLSVRPYNGPCIASSILIIRFTRRGRRRTSSTCSCRRTQRMGEFSTFSSGAPSLLDAVQEFEQIGKRGFNSTKLPVDMHTASSMGTGMTMAPASSFRLDAASESWRTSAFSANELRSMTGSRSGSISVAYVLTTSGLSEVPSVRVCHQTGRGYSWTCRRSGVRHSPR